MRNHVLAADHGSNTVTVSGIVTQFTPSKPATGFLRWLKSDTPNIVDIKIDEEPYQKLVELFLHDSRAQGVTAPQHIKFYSYDASTMLLQKDVRVLITFSYASEEESWCTGAPAIRVKDVVPIWN